MQSVIPAPISHALGGAPVAPLLLPRARPRYPTNTSPGPHQHARFWKWELLFVYCKGNKKDCWCVHPAERAFPSLWLMLAGATPRYFPHSSCQECPTLPWAGVLHQSTPSQCLICSLSTSLSTPSTPRKQGAHFFKLPLSHISHPQTS